jgi:hypothetical protein
MPEPTEIAEQVSTESSQDVSTGAEQARSGGPTRPLRDFRTDGSGARGASAAEQGELAGPLAWEGKAF